MTGDESIVYREWDMDNDLVTEYERQGECLHCGECCRHRIALSYTDDKAAPGIHGIWNEARADGWSFCVQVTQIAPERSFDDDYPCSKLTEDNLCSIHGQSTDNQQLCDQWPLAPRCLEHFPQCGYSFTEVCQDQISVAYPSTWAILVECWQREQGRDLLVRKPDALDP